MQFDVVRCCNTKDQLTTIERIVCAEFELPRSRLLLPTILLECVLLFGGRRVNHGEILRMKSLHGESSAVSAWTCFIHPSL